MVPTRFSWRRPLAPMLAAAILATAVVPAPALASLPAGAARSASLSSLALHRKDLPASFGTSIVEQGLTIDNANDAVYLHTTAATVSQHGRVAGYQTILGSRDPAHAFSLLDTVDRYRSAAGAHWELVRDKSLHAAPAPAQHLNTSGIGDESWGYTEFGPGGGAAGVYFRRGHYWARVYILAFSSVSAGDILRLARTLDGRIRHAG